MKNSVADTLGLIETIAPNDDMFTGDREHYLAAGRSAITNITAAMNTTPGYKCNSILDIPCGYGRVLRHLAARFPSADITACDLNREAVDFCVSTFGSKGFYSAKHPEDLHLRDTFDLIWCGSLLTHLDKPFGDAFIKFFSERLNIGGILVFTTHGRISVNWLSNNHYDYGLNRNDIPYMLNSYKMTGFGYLDYPNVSDYGVSIASSAWVLALIQRHMNLSVLSFVDGGWDHHQDVISCTRN